MGRSCRAGVVPAAATSLALVLGGLSAASSAPTSRLADDAQVAIAQVEAVVLTAVDAATSSPAATPVSVGATQNDQQSVPAAAATVDIGTTIGRIALTAVGLIISPLWYLAAPITLPVAIVATFSKIGLDLNPSPGPDMGVRGMFQVIALGLGLGLWLGFPLTLPSLVFPDPPAQTLVPESAAARTGSSAQPVASSDELAQQRTGTAAADTVTAIHTARGALAARSSDRARSHRSVPASAASSAVAVPSAENAARTPGEESPASEETPAASTKSPSLAARMLQDSTVRKGSAGSRHALRDADRPS